MVPDVSSIGYQKCSTSLHWLNFVHFLGAAAGFDNLAAPLEDNNHQPTQQEERRERRGTLCLLHPEHMPATAPHTRVLLLLRVTRDHDHGCPQPRHVPHPLHPLPRLPARGDGVLREPQGELNIRPSNAVDVRRIRIPISLIEI